mmetsp:Transcript_105590/g.275726  ORF Transcript_105590/g.275726 Transcript_105590/m.275726 type:complete len:102 (+) Transcript_105590:82-387(+)
MPRRSSSSRIAAAALSLAAAWCLASIAATAFVPAPAAPAETAITPARVAQAAVIGGALAAPEAAQAANQGYAVLQLGWAVFIIGLGPAVLFWIYFNKPELL